MRKVISVRLSKDEVQAIDVSARLMQVSRSELLRAFGLAGSRRLLEWRDTADAAVRKLAASEASMNDRLG